VAKCIVWQVLSAYPERYMHWYLRQFVPGLEFRLRPLTRLVQNEELGCTAVKREEEEEWVTEDGDDHHENSLHLPRGYLDT
jgi:hypothetical protein